MSVEVSSSLYVLIGLLVTLALAVAGVAVKYQLYTNTLDYLLSDFCECIKFSFNFNISMGYKAPVIGIDYTVKLKESVASLYYEVPGFGVKVIRKRVSVPILNSLTFKPGDFILIKPGERGVKLE